MNFTYILHSALPKTEAFSDFGFKKSAERQFVLKKALSGDAADFFVLMTLSLSDSGKTGTNDASSFADSAFGSLIAEVFDSTTGKNTRFLILRARTAHLWRNFASKFSGLQKIFVLNALSRTICGQNIRTGFKIIFRARRIFRGSPKQFLKKPEQRTLSRIFLAITPFSAVRIKNGSRSL